MENEENSTSYLIYEQGKENRIYINFYKYLKPKGNS